VLFAVAMNVIFTVEARNAQRKEAASLMRQPMLGDVYCAAPEWTPGTLVRVSGITLVGGAIAGVCVCV
jgi:hypothetical protein